MQCHTKLKALCVCALFMSTTVCQTPPDYAPSATTRLEVSFTKGHVLEPGGFLKPQDAEHLPIIGARYLNIFDKYIAFMMDAEVAHPPIAYPLLHWYQPDLRVVQSQPGMYILGNSSDDGAPYVGPQPIPGPRHTYVLLLFRQPFDFEFPNCFDSIFPISVETRAGFDLRRFMEITGLGNPVAANYFTSENPQKPPRPPGRVTTTSLSHAPCATAHTDAGRLREKLS